MTNYGSGSGKTNGYLKAIAKGILSIPLIIVLILVMAGRTTYWQGWVFSIYICSRSLIASIIFAKKPDVVKERFKPGPGTVWWDKLFWALYGPLSFVIIIIAVLDGGRFQWTVELPMLVYIASYALLILSDFVKSWCMWVNRFFSTTVRIQMDRGHKVIQSGPYRFVRHPGYLSGIFMMISIPLVLGSLWGLIPAAVVAVLLIVRTHLEDTYLKRKLPGYASYTKKVKYRLLPKIW
jgi:protein-S-isoprenylcysteine O-methyltransferase Ste14